MSEDEPKTAETNDPMTEIQPYSNQIGITNADDPESADQTPCQVEKPIEHSEYGTVTMDTQPEHSKSDVESQIQILVLFLCWFGFVWQEFVGCFCFSHKHKS